MQPNPLRALILDDDPWMARVLEARLRSLIPDLQVVHRVEPDCSGQFDVYLVDNSFEAGHAAVDLVHEIRADRPDAVVIVLSGNLRREELVALVSAKCDQVYEKGGPEVLEQLAVDVARELRWGRRPARRRGFGATLRALRELVGYLGRQGAHTA